MPATLSDSCERICIVLLTGLGDVVMGLPVANALKRDDPRRRITWVAEPMPAGVLRHHPAIDEVVVFEKRRGWRGVLDLWRALSRRRFDVTLNLNIYFKSVFPMVFSRAPHRVTVDRGRARDGVWLFGNHQLAPRPRGHTLDLFLEFLEWFGLRDYRVEWRLTLSEEERRKQAEFFERLGGDRPVAVLVPSSSRPSKDWFADRYAEVVDALEFDFGFRTVLVGGPGERETRIAREIVERARARPVWAMGDDVRRVVWVIAGSQLVVAPDTGPVHIARALDVPVIGLYGHTNPWRVGPYRKFEDLWVDRYTDEGEPPDPSRTEPKSGRMELITVTDVLERIQRAVDRYIPGEALRR